MSMYELQEPGKQPMLVVGMGFGEAQSRYFEAQAERDDCPEEHLRPLSRKIIEAAMVRHDESPAAPADTAA